MATLAKPIGFSGPAVADQDDELRQPALVEVGSGPIVLRDQLPRWIPSGMQLGALRDSRLRLLEPLEVAISQEEGQILAEALELNEFGWGANLSDAISDLQRAISELYFQLDAEQQRLGAGLQAVWTTLRAKIHRA